MSKELDMILDKCIDRVNKGESLENCLRSYPEHAVELSPLLRVVSDAHQACSSVPQAKARFAQRRRLDAAITKAKSATYGTDRTKHRWIMKPSFGWTKAWAVVSIVLLLSLIGFGLHWGLTPGATPVIAQNNFRLLVSDVENAIGDFKRLDVTVSSIGVLRGGESGRWEVINLEPNVVVDLTRLQGLNAQEVWGGILPEGQYRTLFIDIEGAIGILNDNQTVEVTVPSGYMQISKPFAVTSNDSTVNFVFDITVIAAGNERSSVEYILLPQIKQSGANLRIHEVGEGELTLQVVDGNVTVGGNITVLVTLEGNPVAGALVTVNRNEVGNTTADGRISFIIPSFHELEIKAVKAELTGELEINLEHEHQEGRLTIQVVDGNVTIGGNITVLVTFEGNPVAGALVIVNRNEMGNTASNGLISFIVPAVDELEIKAVKGEWEGELEINLEHEHQEGRLTIQVVDGNVTIGGNITVLVTFQGNPVAGALVTVNDYEVGNTASTGHISFIVPLEDELEIRAMKGELEGELEINLEQEANGPGQEDNGQEHEANGPGQEDNGQEHEANGPGQEDNGQEHEANGPGQEDNGQEHEANGSGQEDNGQEHEDNGQEHEDNGLGQEANGAEQECNGPEQETNGPRV